MSTSFTEVLLDIHNFVLFIGNMAFRVALLLFFDESARNSIKLLLLVVIEPLISSDWWLGFLGLRKRGSFIALRLFLSEQKTFLANSLGFKVSEITFNLRFVVQLGVILESD
jgi:hypothetical protein